MNYAIPMYECSKDETPGRAPLFSCTVDIGGIKYIGAAARTKKEAEIKAARTALLAIQANASGSDFNGSLMYTVVPQKKKIADLGINSQETPAALKPKKRRFKKKTKKKKHATGEGNPVPNQSIASLVVHRDDQLGQGRTDSSVSEVSDLGVSTDEACFSEVVGTASVPHTNGDFEPEFSLLNNGDGLNGLAKEGNETPGFVQWNSTSK